MGNKKENSHIHVLYKNFSFFFTGIGRMMSSDYLAFITALDAYKQSKDRNLKVSKPLQVYELTFI